MQVELTKEEIQFLTRLLQGQIRTFLVEGLIEKLKQPPRGAGTHETASRRSA